MRTPPPQLPGTAPEPPDKSLLPPFPARPVPVLPVPMVPGPQRPAPPPLRAPRPAQRPLPDAVALPSRLPLPAAGPSFDDQAGLDLPSPRTALCAAGPDRAPGGSGTADNGPGPARGPAGLPPEAACPQPEGACFPPPGVCPPPGGCPGPADGRDTGEWASRFAQALAEALAGSRPTRQIAPWTTEQARRRIRQLGPALQAGPQPVVRRVLTSVPRRDVVEMTVIIGIGPRTRAIAVRLERARLNPARPDRGRPWICTVIEAA
jgi:Family of unknown function (DUF6459)